MEIYYLEYSQYEGTYSLANESYPAQYGFYLLVYEDGDAKKYYQREGTLQITYDYYHGIFIYYDDLDATLSGVVLEEVTIDSDSYQTTPVTNGSCLRIKDTTLHYDYEY